MPLFVFFCKSKSATIIKIVFWSFVLFWIKGWVFVRRFFIFETLDFYFFSRNNVLPSGSGLKILKLAPFGSQTLGVSGSFADGFESINRGRCVCVEVFDVSIFPAFLLILFMVLTSLDFRPLLDWFQYTI